MEVATIENDQNPRVNTPKHDWLHLTYIFTFTLCFIIQVYQRITITTFYTSCLSYYLFSFLE